MRTSETPATVAPATRRLGVDRGASGAAVMYVLLVTGLIMVITVAVLLVISADLSTSIRQLQSVRVFNVSEAGVHYGMARLLASGGPTYVGETVAIADGETSLGTAVVTVGCIDGAAMPCSGTYVRYRRIASAGTLPTGGPSRTLVAIVQGINAQVLCAMTSLVADTGVTIYGDIGSNGTIAMEGPPVTYSRVRNDPPTPYSNGGFFNGDATATGAITCSQGCPTHIQGTTTANTNAPVCPPIALPSFSPGSTDLDVDPTGYTMDATTGYNWNEIELEDAGEETGCTGATPFTDLRIQAGAAGTTTVVNVRELDIGRCGRLIILGEGDVELRVEEELEAGDFSRFGVLSTDTLASPAPVPAGRLRVFVGTQPLGDAEVEFDGATIVAGTFTVAGEFEFEDVLAPVSGGTGTLYGAVHATTIELEDGPLNVIYDSSAAMGAPLNFTRVRLRSWKDQ